MSSSGPSMPSPSPSSPVKLVRPDKPLPPRPPGVSPAPPRPVSSAPALSSVLESPKMLSTKRTVRSWSTSLPTVAPPPPPPPPPPLSPTLAVPTISVEEDNGVEEAEYEWEEGDYEDEGTENSTPVAKPDRPVPLPPGKTKEDFSFLFAVDKETAPIDRLHALKETQTKRMSVMMNTQHVPLLKQVPTIAATPLFPSPHSNCSSEEMSSASPRTVRKVVSKSDRLKEVLARIAAAKHSWTVLEKPQLAQLEALSEGKADWITLEELTDPTQLFHLAHLIVLTFPKDILLTGELRDMFVAAAASEDAGRRRLSLYALFHALPDHHSSMLRSVLLAFGGLNSSQLHAASALFEDVMGNKAVVEALTRDYSVLANGDFGDDLLFDPKSRMLSSASKLGLMDLLLNPHYELLDPQFMDMVCSTLKGFMAEEELMELLMERYSQLLMAPATSEFLEARKNLLLFLHHFLLTYKSAFNETFCELLSSLKLMLCEDGNPESMMHVEFLMRFQGSFNVGSPPPRNRFPVDATAAAGCVVPVVLSKTVSEWSAALCVAAEAIFRSVKAEDTICRNWETSSSFVQLRTFFNNLQLFVATAVLSPESQAEQLITLEHWIQIASSLTSLRNFHASFAVYAGLSMACVSRLKALWEQVPSKVVAQFEELRILFDPSKNHQNYQRALDEDIISPAVPNMVLILKWLYTIEEVNASRSSNGNINMEKFRMLFMISEKIASLQSRPSYSSRFSPPLEFVAFCRSIPSSAFQSESALFELSLARAPRGIDASSQKMSFRTQVGAAMLRARASTEQKKGNTSRDSRKESSSLGSSVVPVISTSPTASSSAMPVSELRTSARSVTMSRSSDSKKYVSSVDKKGMVCPVCVKSFLDKSDLLAHLAEGRCGGTKK